MFEIKNLIYRDILHIDHLLLDRPITCIVGPSGSGKTTLLRHLNRLYTPDSGTVLYNGASLETLDPVALRRQVVMLGQTPVLYDGTVADNLQIGLQFSQRPPAPDYRLSAVLEQVGLSQALDQYPDKLSGGERQRLCLARVMLMDADTYLLDEPSAALDKETEWRVLEVLVDFVQKRGKELVLVTHSEQISSRFPEGIVRMDRGRTRGYER